MAVAAFAATHKDMKILTFDVTGAFLQCTWTGEQLYVRLPDDTPTDIRYMGETHAPRWPGGRSAESVVRP